MCHFPARAVLPAVDDSGRLTVQIVEGSELKVYPGAPHGLFATHTEQFNQDLLDFVKA